MSLLMKIFHLFLIFQCFHRPNFTAVPKAQRQRDLANVYQFKCECVACDKDYPTVMKLPRLDSRFVFPDFKKTGTLKESAIELKRNWKYITKHIKRHPSVETEALIKRSGFLLAYLGMKASNPFQSFPKFGEN